LLFAQDLAGDYSVNEGETVVNEFLQQLVEGIAPTDRFVQHMEEYLKFYEMADDADEDPLGTCLPKNTIHAKTNKPVYSVF
jgi:hypothetical protein